MFKRILDLREEQNLKQQEVAEVLMINQSTYSDYERGIINIPIEGLIRLSNFYNTSVDYIVEQTNVREPYPRA